MSNYFFHMLLEADHKEITWWAMTIRGILLFIYGIILIKVGGKRIIGNETAYDITINVIMGALLAIAIVGNADIVSILITTFAMAVFYNLLSRLAFFNRLTEKFVKGKSELIIKEGKFHHDAMKKHSISEHDIIEVLRNENKTDKVEDIEEAHVEASGKISIILKKDSHNNSDRD